MGASDRLELLFDHRTEFPQLEGNIYLDHAGSTLYSKSQIDQHSKLLISNGFSNPHSKHSFSTKTSKEINRIRNRILSFFGADPTKYSLLFTSGATASFRLLAESFEFGQNGLFAHLREIHTSVLGMRETAKLKNAEIICVTETDLGDDLLSSQFGTHSNKLFAIPGQCNFSGKKYDPKIIDRFRRNGWRVLLDAASLAATSELKLSEWKPDFVALSFYKIFGFPTGLGALIVHKDAECCLKKVYFGGGTVEIAVGEEQFHAFRQDFVQRFEDGTLPFLDILALDSGLDAIETLGGGMSRVSRYLFSLAKYTYDSLSSLRHRNGTRVVELYTDGGFTESRTQGPIIAFNLLRSDGSYVGFASVEKVFESFSIQARTGCFCNTGACQKYLGLTTEDLKNNFNAGHVCGDSVDLVNGKPTGAIRISFGYTSTYEDADALLSVISEIFVEKVPMVPPPVPSNESHIGVVTKMFLYPVKSCRRTPIESWAIGPEGFKYDRRFFIQNSKRTTMTLKHNPKLHNITCNVDLTIPELILSAPGIDDYHIGLFEPCACGYLKGLLNMARSEEETDDGSVFSRICGLKVKAYDCGEAAASWLSSYLTDDSYKLLKYRDRPSGSSSHSAANSAPFLVICTASLRHLAASVPEPYALSMDQLIERMRPNIVVETSVPFEEDYWTKISIGGIQFEIVEKCSRCQMVSVDPISGERTVEPLKTITRLRGEKMFFGVLVRPVLTTADDGSEEKMLNIKDIVEHVSQ